jgi:hypothetical protein
MRPEDRENRRKPKSYAQPPDKLSTLRNEVRATMFVIAYSRPVNEFIDSGVAERRAFSPRERGGIAARLTPPGVIGL